jgi:ABC-type branched-subunit amino acid transport system ATPase component/ABC-type branched-subunit amino acid transport system permease subunit
MILGIDLPLPVVLLGAITGMTYGILAVGLILVYRSSRIINFAHGEIGAFGAALAGTAVIDWHLPYLVAFGLAVAAAAAIGALADVLVMRRLRSVPVVMSVVATLGLGQALLLISQVVNARATAGQVYPQPPLPSFDVGALRVTPSYFGMLFLTPVVVTALAWFLRTRYGLAVRAAAANHDAARVAGVSAARVSAATWAIAGAVSAYTATLVRPSQGFVRAEALGPGLLLRALAAAVLGGMVSLPTALAAGIGLGIVEQALKWNFPRAGLVEMVLFVVILGGLTLRRRDEARGEDRGQWAAVQAWPPLADSLRRIAIVRYLGKAVAVAAAAAAVVATFVVSDSGAVHLTVMASFALVGLSVAIVTGLSGQLSLGQFGLAGIGAVASYQVTQATGNYVLGFGAAAAAAGAASVVVAVPALRIRGLMLAVTTLSFALAASAWLLQQPWMLGRGVEPGRPGVGSLVLNTSKRYYLFALAVLAVGVWLASNVWRGGVGRRLRAVRDNEDAARAFTVSATSGKITGFVLAGLIAGLGGAVYGHALAHIDATTFPIEASITSVVTAVLGGLGVVAGPLMGVLYIVGLPGFVHMTAAGLAATAIGWLLILLVAPGGFAQLLRPARDRLVAWLAAARRTDDVPPPDRTDPPSLSSRLGVRASAHRELGAGEPLLEARGLEKRYGGVRAIGNVDFELRPGETVGLIGPNGAGKTTLFEVLSGFTRPDSGTVRFLGRDITRLGPEARAQRGLIRSFQDASLFPTFTTLDAVKLAMERTHPTRVVPSVLGVDRTERVRDERARELLHVMGLDRFRSTQVRELSTGTRRIAELTCLLALEPTVLLLDEPSSGIAQAETEALAELLEDIKRELHVALVVIEHDIPLVMGVADRIVVLESGVVIASGAPAEVRANQAVVDSYLGVRPKRRRRRRTIPAEPAGRS